ncbi:MAG: hypothetical protein SX243_21895 [Acidobacteriota bacterium]|nr:hypothetical protein [Acidobacteriota bacterium]
MSREGHETPSAPPRGLVLFPPGTPPEVRRRRVTFVGIVIAAALALVWPVASWVANPLPLVLGLPMSLAWIVGWLLVVCAGLAWMYRGDRKLPEPEVEGADGGSEPREDGA